MELNREQIALMAVAVIAEEEKMDVSALRIVSFREVHKSSLEQYIEDHGIKYKKYRLGE